jgi:hypothetical protein
MPDLVVLRGAGINQGDDIVEPLLTTDHAAMARGTVALDEGSGLAPVSLECWYRDGLRLGQVIQVDDPFSGGSRYGKLVSIVHRREGVTLYSSLGVVVLSKDVL